VIEEKRGLFAIFDDMYGNFNATCLDCFPDEENIGGVVFNDQNMRVTRCFSLFEGW